MELLVYAINAIVIPLNVWAMVSRRRERSCR